MISPFNCYRIHQTADKSVNLCFFISQGEDEKNDVINATWILIPFPRYTFLCVALYVSLIPLTIILIMKT